MDISEVPAFGWQRCLRLANASVEVLVSLEVGPRILSYRYLAGENVLRTFPKQMGTAGEPDYQVRGGHRLWISPETKLTYTPDNAPVTLDWTIGDQNVTLVNPATEECPVRKELTLALSPTSTQLSLDHRLINEGAGELEIAAWGITVMRPGGFEIIPQPPLGSHDTDLLPNRVIVPWTYTDFSDPRWRFGTRYWRLTPSEQSPATKLGFALRPGWAGYALPDALFLKTFAYEDGATYPDMGCNFETFSKGDFIELESLSPVQRLGPGESVGHAETWYLFADTVPAPGIDEAALEEGLRPVLSSIGLR
jgi:hypothetical protein